MSKYQDYSEPALKVIHSWAVTRERWSRSIILWYHTVLSSTARTWSVVVPFRWMFISLNALVRGILFGFCVRSQKPASGWPTALRTFTVSVPSTRTPQRHSLKELQLFCNLQVIGCLKQRGIRNKRLIIVQLLQTDGKGIGRFHIECDCFFIRQNRLVVHLCHTQNLSTWLALDFNKKHR